MYTEQVLLAGGLQLEVAFLGEENWNLSLRKEGKVLVEYSSARPRAFQSVEKLRYDFEKDVEDALRKGR